MVELTIPERSGPQVGFRLGYALVAAACLALGVGLWSGSKRTALLWGGVLAGLTVAAVIVYLGL